MAQVLDWCTTLHIRLTVDWNPAVPLVRMELNDPVRAPPDCQGEEEKGRGRGGSVPDYFREIGQYG